MQSDNDCSGTIDNRTVEETAQSTTLSKTLCTLALSEPRKQLEPATRTRGRTAEMERREARHLRQRRRQRSRARVSDLASCEPRKPHCRSDPTIPPPNLRPRARTPKHTARAAARPPMREPQRQEPATRTRGRTAEKERREARHLRQRRRQRSRARVSDLAAYEPRKPHCCSDPTRPPPTTDKPSANNRPCILTAKHTA
jgi:hypothetical protein